MKQESDWSDLLDVFEAIRSPWWLVFNRPRPPAIKKSKQKPPLSWHRTQQPHLKKIKCTGKKKQNNNNLSLQDKEAFGHTKKW